MEEKKIEEKYLSNVIAAIDNGIKNLDLIIDDCNKRIEYIQQNIQDEHYGMDEEELVSHQQIVENEDQKIYNYEKIKSKFQKQRMRPYFARIDFVPSNEICKQQFYIGLGIILKDNKPLVIDWRAPISSMFYDYDKGFAKYKAPQGIIEGEITLKRQYKIQNSQLEYFFDSDFKVDDDVLQKELAVNSTNKMKSIVSTIQKQQNEVIRNDNCENLLVQGVAGSGKTSIAMHRVAYLLYNYKGTLSSDEILVISPNNVFSTYINGVLPELCESEINQMSYSNFLKRELNDFISFSQYETMFDIAITNSKEYSDILNYKEGFEFAENLEKYIKIFSENCFIARDLKFGDFEIKSLQLSKLYYETYKLKPPYLRVRWICEYILDLLDMPLSKQELVMEKLKKIIYSMFKTTDILIIYKDFLTNIGIDSKNIGFEDATALLYIKYQLFGISTDTKIKHLIIDEMQDYSPLSYLIFNEVFKCRKTILGDIYQSLYKRLDEDYLTKLKNLFESCELIKLEKSYRSTVEINSFSKKFLNIEYEVIDRKGDPVTTIKLSSFDELNNLLSQLKTQYNTIAIITDTTSLAERIFIKCDQEDVNLIDGKSDSLSQVNIVPLCYAKGLEFDAVLTIINDYNNNLYNNAMYLATTRALHKLIVMELSKDIF